MQDKNAIDNFFEKNFLDGLYNANNTVNCAIKNIPLISNNKKIDFGNENENMINQGQCNCLNELKKRINLDDPIKSNDMSNNINSNFLLNNFSLNSSLISNNIVNFLKKNENLSGNSNSIQDYLPSLKNILKNNSLFNRNNIININSINNINTINKINDLNPNLSQNINLMNGNVLSQKDNLNTNKNFPMPIFPTLFNNNLLNPNNNNNVDNIVKINNNSANNNPILDNIKLTNRNSLDFLLFKNDLSNINKSGIINDTNSVHKKNNENNIILGIKRGNNSL